MRNRQWGTGIRVALTAAAFAAAGFGGSGGLAATTVARTDSGLRSVVGEQFGARRDTVFEANGQSGVTQLSLQGNVLRSFATGYGFVVLIGMDNSGNVYVQSLQNTLQYLFLRFTVGGSRATATYVPTSTAPVALYAAPTGEVVILGTDGSPSSGGSIVYDVWDAGSKGGAPSRTLMRLPHKLPSGVYGFSETLAIAADGSLYIPYIGSSGKQVYDVIPAGSSQPSQRIVESIVPPNSRFFANFMTVAPDGTLYVGEWNFSKSDHFAGLYVYPRVGRETDAASGAPYPTGVDFDRGGNVYVVNSNALFTGSGWTPDTVHTLSVYTPHAASLLRQVTKGFRNIQGMTVADDGTAYLIDYGTGGYPSVVDVDPKATSGSVFYEPLGGVNVVLYNGARVKNSRRAGGTSGLR